MSLIDWALPWITSNPEATEDSSLDLTNGHRIWTSGRLKLGSWLKLYFSSWALKWNDSVATYFLMKPDRGASEQTSELSSRPEEMIHLPHLQPISSHHDAKPLIHSVLWFCPI